MVQLTAGLKNSLLVLELLRYDQGFNQKYEVAVGCFTNCREVGLTFTLIGAYGEDNKYQSMSTDCFTFCVYEHRNSDEIIINGKSGYVSLNGDLPYGGETKYDYLAAFSYNQHYEAAEKLKELIEEKFAEHAVKNSITVKE